MRLSCVCKKGFFPINLKDLGKTPLQGYFVSKERTLTLVAPTCYLEDFSFAAIEISPHRGNFQIFRQDET